ncbi:MAG: hypothetical protein PVF96_02805 [Candidatus Bathyarchaeota archaeon]
MKKFSYTFSVLLILFTVIFVHFKAISIVEASPDIHQGDLIIQGNNVTIIEGDFHLNGSLIIEENATLILRNAVLNFTQSYSYQFYMNIQHPIAGRPRLNIENSTITSNHYLYVQFYANSSIIGDTLSSPPEIRFYTHDASETTLSNSQLYQIHAFSSSTVTTSDSQFDWLVGEGYSNITAYNCTIESARAGGNANFIVNESRVTYDIISEVYSVNCSMNDLQSGNVNYWNLGMNSSIIVAPTGWTPNLTVINSDISSWSFILRGFSNATISNCKLTRLGSEDYAVVHVHNSTNDGWLSGKDFSTCYVYGTTIDLPEAHHNATLWLVNSTYRIVRLYGLGKIYANWYLDTHVLDSISQDVPSANVTVYPSLPIPFNLTIYESKMTDENGLVRLTLMEKMMNATGEYPVGNYTVEATYDIYSASTQVNMTENKQITLKLEDFVIPELPSPLIVPLFMIITLFLVTISKRKWKS